jgi:hypothetical protein
MTKTYVTLDGEWNDTLDAYETAFAVERLGAPWNGFATPVVNPTVMTAIIGWQMLCDPTFDAQRFAWDGNGVLVQDADPDVEDEWIMPDEDGNFDLGQLGWTFMAVSDDDNVVRRIG